MNQLLELGDTVRTEFSGLVCTVQEFLGGGGQGEVYRAGMGGKQVALKWYFPHTATQEQWRALDTLIKQGRPNERFLWPEDLATTEHGRSFGYVMPLRPKEYRSLVDLMLRRCAPTFQALATAGLELSDSFFQLHAQGLCYRDISFGNVFFDPASGEILICDNDNVGIDGQPGLVAGTPRFMAPEIVRGEAQPSSKTDLFSLAVLLFYLFVIHHPLDGQKALEIHCLDLAARRRLFGDEPVFIFDPHDRSNRPVPGEHDNALAFWPIYPQFIRHLFTRSFTDGIRDPQNGRVRESEWRLAMADLRDSICYCGHCGGEGFYDLAAYKASGGRPGSCPFCKRELSLPPRIRIGKRIVVLNHDTQLCPHHVDDDRMYDFSRPVAEVVQHPTNPNIWGLRNLSTEKWVGTKAGELRDIEPGRAMTLAPGIKINFGKKEGEVSL